MRAGRPAARQAPQVPRDAEPERCSSHTKGAKTCKGFLESPLGIGKLLAEPVRCNGMTQLVFAFLAILA